MLKIDLVETGDDVVMRLEGLVVGPWVDELRKWSERALADSRRVTLDLEGVSFVDRDGVELLRGLRRQAVAVANCSRFVEQQLKA